MYVLKKYLNYMQYNFKINTISAFKDIIECMLTLFLEQKLVIFSTIYTKLNFKEK